MLTKKDLIILEEIIDRKLEEKLEQKLEEKLEQKFEEKLRDFKEELYTKIDRMITLLSKTDEEQVLISGRVSEHTDQLEEHEGRIVLLEKKKLPPPN